MYTVYMHVNKVNNKKYIGITKQNPKSRWKANGAGYKSQNFYRAIEKYGWNNFEHVILCDNLTKEDAENMEISLITKYQTMNDNYGYNVHKGGNISYARCLSIEQYLPNGNFIKKYDSITNASDETGIDLSQIAKCCRGKITHAQDYIWCYVGNKPILGYNPKEERSVEQYSLECEYINTYSSIANASILTGMDRHGIYDCCENNQNSAYGYYWCYKGKYNYKGKSIRYTKVKQYNLLGELIETFDNILDASTKTGINRDCIGKCCNNDGVTTSGGFVWRFENDKFEKYPIKKLTKIVEQYDLEMKLISRFDSVAEASKITKVSAGLISLCCTNKRETGRGYIWRYSIDVA